MRVESLKSGQWMAGSLDGVQGDQVGADVASASVYLTLLRGCTISHERSVGICTRVEHVVSREGKPVRKGVVWQVLLENTSGLVVDSKLVPAVCGEKSPSASCRPRVQECGADLSSRDGWVLDWTAVERTMESWLRNPGFDG